VRALQSDHGHGRATDVTGADAANLNQREKEKYDLGEYKKPRCCCLQKTKLRDRSREWKRREISSDARTTTTRRERGENDVREKKRGKERARNSKRTFGNLDHNYYVLCVCVLCVFKDEDNKYYNFLNTQATGTRRSRWLFSKKKKILKNKEHLT